MLERNRFWAILVLFIASTLFWSAYEQASSTLNLFAEQQHKPPRLGLPYSIPRQLFSSLQFGVHPQSSRRVFAWLWLALRRHEPTNTAKFSIGLVFVGLGLAIQFPSRAAVWSAPGGSPQLIFCTPSVNSASAR